ncbi:MAG: hypothetical protein KME06_04495 [Kastovskya adunca ATA6-11-RM4]|jgi:hypothetical protein|nr:hypothetical protein [Kastovskya adunca ATA6-11-RM4]
MFNKPLEGNFRTGAIALALSAFLLPACSANRTDTATVPDTQENVTAEDVADNTAALVGQTVTVRSEIEEAIGTNAFKIEDDQFFNGEDILVVNATGQPLPVVSDDDTELQVTGEVRQFVIADVEREFNLGLERELYVEYENRPAIVAQSIALAPEPGEVTENPNLFYGKTLAVKGEVEDIVGPTAFTIDEDQLTSGGDLLVLVANPERTIADGEAVVATGQLRPFVIAEIERDYDLTWDLDLQRQLEVEYKDRPVLIADDVYPSAVEDAL